MASIFRIKRHNQTRALKANEMYKWKGEASDGDSHNLIKQF